MVDSDDGFDPLATEGDWPLTVPSGVAHEISLTNFRADLPCATAGGIYGETAGGPTASSREYCPFADASR